MARRVFADLTCGNPECENKGKIVASDVFVAVVDEGCGESLVNEDNVRHICSSCLHDLRMALGGLVVIGINHGNGGSEDNSYKPSSLALEIARKGIPVIEGECPDRKRAEVKGGFTFEIVNRKTGEVAYSTSGVALDCDCHSPSAPSNSGKSGTPGEESSSN